MPASAPAQELWRRRRLRQIGLLVSLPGLILGTATVSAAYSAGLMDPTAAASCQPTLVPAPSKASFDVQVLNATGEPGVAASVSKELGARGFRISNSGNAPESMLVRGPAQVTYGEGGRDAALYVASQVPGAVLEMDGRSTPTVDLALGLSYTHLVPVPPRPAPKPSTITVNVWNTTYHEGLASRVQKDLVGRGFTAGKTGNDPLRTWQQGVGLIRHGADGKAQAEVLAQHLPGMRFEQDQRKGTSLDVVLGNKYSGLAALKSVPVPPPVTLPTTPTVARPCTTD